MLMFVYISCLSFRNHFVWVGDKTECIFQQAGPEVTFDVAYSVVQVQGKKRREIRPVLLERQRKEWLGRCQVNCQLDRLCITA